MTGMVDMHTHILPGVDDGAADMSEALEIIDAEYRQGVRHIILTPHYRPGLFEAGEEEIRAAFAKLQKAVTHEDLRLYLGCEHYTGSEFVSNIQAGARPSLGGGRYVLAEFSSAHMFSLIRNQVEEITQAGYIPIIAHAERCRTLTEGPVKRFAGSEGPIAELRHFGAEIQVTADVLTTRTAADGHIRRFVWKLIENGLVDYVASDAHNMAERAPQLDKAAALISRKAGNTTAQRLLIYNPLRIVEEHQ